MSVEIKEVLTKKDLLRWVRFPTALYKGNKYFVPFLEPDEVDTFTKDKNPSYEFCETKLFLAYKDGKIVGRIAGLINHAYNKKWDKNAIRYTRFDFIDDYEVSKALFDSVVAWGKERGYTEIVGPVGFTDMDHEGMLIEGFEELNLSITFYNYPYYIDHMERLGLSKDVDWIEYRISVPDKVDEQIERISDMILKKGNYKIVTYNDRKVLFKEAYEAFSLVDRAYSKLHGTVPLTDKVIENVINSNVPIINLDYICSVKDSEGKIVAFGVMVPSTAKALKKSNGRLFPLGIVRMLKALNGKNDTLEMYFVAVEPQLQNQGIPALLICALLKNLIKNGVKYCETGPMLESNTAVQSLWRRYDKVQHKRRRCYIKSI
ncbi:MAG: hypothetical protein E7358_03385 [Clostridiales bacterium]|nr:hypothetical protein [Clostridiales bacterium]